MVKKINLISHYSLIAVIILLMAVSASCISKTETPAAEISPMTAIPPTTVPATEIPATAEPAEVATEAPADEPVNVEPAYLNPDLPVEQRVDDLLARMTLEEKVGQMILIEKGSLGRGDVARYYLGGVLSGGGGSPRPNTLEDWVAMVDGFQEEAISTNLGIPIIYGVDAVHGHNNLYGATIFPHNIGLGAANDPDLMYRIGQATAEEMAATGIYWDYAPVLAVAQDIRWGRIYESYSENTDLVTALAVPYIQGLQGDDLAVPNTVLATIKHYVGDGGTAWGTGDSGYQIDQGVTEVDEATLRAIFLPPYQAAIDAGAKSLMVSFSSWGGMKMHAQKYLITDVLRGEMGFDGFIVSDWAGINQISGNYYNDVVTAINAGIDMSMEPYSALNFIGAVTQAVEAGDISMERIDEAVRNILTVKFELGLFEHPFSNPEMLATVGSEAHRELAREAVSKSLVLLKNENSALPLSKNSGLLYVAGQAADDIGMMCGGWTIEWQGKTGAITPGTTILQAIENTVSADTTVVYDQNGNFDEGTTADACVVVLGEKPYAEGQGDSNNLKLSSGDLRLLERFEGLCDNLVVVLVSGRPLIVSESIDNWDALVAAWLPGTEGQGVADVLFGDGPFTGKLSFTWPRAVEQLPFDFNNLGTGEQDPLFPFGFGLEY
jgi:beta-glucosidase